ncbi:sensor histidine kinase [Actinomadura terrae]|uniref:sensor histidine kinase n=1 Tax=Actinomadura terrae TaxID=604353 RepID=UPI001FA798C8|nr:ATP-binding protein [Actinomadura terrae]
MARQTRLVLALAAGGAVITLAIAVVAADAATRRVLQQRARAVAREQETTRRRLGELALLVTRGRRDLQRLAEGLSAGETAMPYTEDQPPPDGADPVIALAYEVRQAQGAAWNTVLGAATREPDRASQRVGVFVNLARRMQSLSHRAIQGLDELENQVEDPDLLKGLFKVDHLTTRTRRQAESLAVIGGAASRRQWTRPVSVFEVLRSAIAEVEHYNRVKVVPPIEGELHGGAVADVVHLLAELIENATKFSPPSTQVHIRVETVSAGLAIEVEDRGLGIPRGDQRRLNDLLADHERADTEELLKDGRIGLLVVSALARRHKVRVQLQGNVYGGTQAVVVVPKELDGRGPDESGPQSQPQPQVPVQAQAPAQAPAPAPAQPKPSGPRHAAPPQPAPAPAHAQAPAPVPAPAPAPAPTPAPAPAPVPVAAAAPAQPSTRPSPPPTAPVPGPPPAPAAAPAPSGSAGERPPLPRRQAQTHIAPELAQQVDVAAPPDDEAEIEHNPGLMAAFKRGVRSAEETDGAPDGSGGAN